MQLIRSLLRFDPDLPMGRLWVAPALPDSYVPLRVEGVALGDRRIGLAVSADGAELENLPEGIEVRDQPVGSDGSAPGR